MQSFLNVENVSFQIGDKHILSDINFQLQSGNIAALLGPSGCGKTTILRQVAGFMPPTAGRILQWDKFYNIYHHPEQSFIANFVGQGVMVKATVITENAVESALGIVQSHEKTEAPVGTQLCMLVHPDDIVEDKNAEQTAVISHKFFHGASTLYELDYQGVNLVANVNSHANYAVGETIHFAVKAHHVVTFEHEEAECVC